MASVEESTQKKYYYAFRNWTEWVDSFQQCSLPANPNHVSLYLTHLMEEGKSSSVLQAAYYSIRWFHAVCGFKDPTDLPITNKIVEAAKRINGKPVNKKEPISTEIIRKLNALLNTPQIAQKDFRFLTMA